MTHDTLRRRPYDPRRPLVWTAIIAALLAIPLIAMRMTGEVDWTAGDFLFAAIVFGAVATGYELAARAAPNGWYRLGAALALLVGLALVWSNAAVGIVGDGGGLNLAFFAMPLLAIGGALSVRGRSAGLARVMIAMTGLQALSIAAAVLWDPFAAAPLAMFTLVWLAAAWCFRRAAL